MSSAQAIANVESRTVKPRRGQRSIAERRRIVDQTLAPSASVKAVAEANDVRPNQLFKWRRQFREGRLGPLPAAPAQPALLPVHVIAPKRKAVNTSGAAKTKTAPGTGSGSIQVEFSHCRVFIAGAVDLTTLRAVMESLTR